MQTKDFPSVIAVKKSTQPLIEQYKNMMDTEQKTNMLQISKELVKKVIATLDAYGCGAHHPDLLPLLDQPEGEPVAWECDAGIGLIRYVTDKKYKKFTPAIQKHYKPFAHPAPFTPITADDVTDGMIHDWHANTFGTQSMGVTDRDMIAAAVNAWGAKK